MLAVYPGRTADRKKGAGHAGDGEGIRIGGGAMTSGNGSGRTFVLVPGAWCRADIWVAVAQRLRAADCAVSALTLTGLEPGTQVDPSMVGLQDHVDDVARHLIERDLREVVLVGHSYSGLVVGQVADRTPDRVAGTVFCSPSCPLTGARYLTPSAATPRRRHARSSGTAAGGPRLQKKGSRRSTTSTRSRLGR